MRCAKILWVTGFVAAGCGAQPGPSREPPRAAPPSPAPRAAASASAEPPREQAEVPPEPVPDGCYTDVLPDDEAEPLLEHVAQSCMVDMTPVAPEPLLVNLQAGALKDLPFTVMDPSKCFRAIATGAKDVKELTLQIVDRSDQVLAEDKLSGAIALANPDGPICVKDPGQYRAVVRMVSGSGHVAVQVWQAE